MAKVRLQANDHAPPIEVTLDRTRGRDDAARTARIDERAVEYHHEGDASRGWIRIGDRIAPYRAIRRDNRVLIWVDGRQYEFEIAQRTAQRMTGAAASGATGDLIAPMPGTVLAIKVAKGDDVEAGQAIIVMESMKMEMTIAAPAAGRVRDIACREGALVERGQLLTRLTLRDNA